MAERLQEVLAEVVPAIQTLIAKCRAADDAQLKATFAEIKQLLLSNRLATLTKIDNAAILVCPWNRFGTGLDVSDVHSILDDVCAVGVDWELMGVPMCFQLPEGEDGEKIIHFNEELANSSNGFLSPVDRHHQEDFVMSVTCSHWVAGLRCVQAACAHIEKLEENIGTLTNEALAGMQWIRVRREMHTAMPELAAFSSEAGNADSGIAREHTVTQVPLQIHQKAKTNKIATGDWQWDKVATAIEKAHIGQQGQVRDMTSYVAAWSGGVVPVYLQHLDDFAKTLTARKSITPFMMGALAKVPLTQCPDFITSCVMAMMAAPSAYTNAAGESTLLNGSEVYAISEKHKKKAMEANDKIEAAREWTREISLPKPQAFKCLGAFQQRLVMHVFNKKTKTTFKNLADVAAQFVQDVRTANAGAAQCAKPPFAEKIEDVQQTKGSVALRSFSSGSLSATALPPAVAQGNLVVDGEKNQFKVKSVFTDSGKLLLAPCDEARKDDVQHHRGAVHGRVQGLRKERIVTHRIADLFKAEAHCDIMTDNVKSQIELALHHLYQVEGGNVNLTVSSSRRAPFLRMSRTPSASW